MTLTEVVVALAISALAVGAIFNGYNYSVTPAVKTSLSLAAQAKAMGRWEQIRCARWDAIAWPVVGQPARYDLKPDQEGAVEVNC